MAMFDPVSYAMGYKKGGGGGGGDITTQALTVTSNGDYVAPAKKAYTPVYVRLPEAEQATPVIEVDSATGEITATATQDAGVVTAGEKTATQQLSVQGARTITPGTSSQTIAAGKYLTGAQTIEGDADLVSQNIAAGVEIFGVTGTYSDDADATAANILSGKTAYAGGTKLVGTAEAYFDGETVVLPEGLVTLNA